MIIGIRAVVAIAIALLPSIVFAQVKADELVKPVSVCDVLLDLPRFNGKDVAVFGRFSSYCEQSRLTADDCGRKLETDGHVWPNSLSLELYRSPAPVPPGGLLLLDHPALIEKLAHVRESPVWTVFYGRVETREKIEKSRGFSPFGALPAQLVSRREYELNFDAEGRPIEVVHTSSGCMIEIAVHEPIETTLCELVRAPEHYHGRVVQVRTAVHPFGVDTPTVLFDQSCSAQVRLDPSNEPSAKGGTPSEKLNGYLMQHRVVEATVSGRFERVLVLDGDSYFRLILQSVSDVAANPPEERQ